MFCYVKTQIFIASRLDLEYIPGTVWRNSLKHFEIPVEGHVGEILKEKSGSSGAQKNPRMI